MVKEFTKEFLDIQPYDEKEDKLQCLECGGWFRGISFLHLRKHGLTVSLYKEKYGINRWQTLANFHCQNIHSIIGNEIGKHNLKPAPLVGGGIKGRKNTRRQQTLVQKHPQLVKMAKIVKEGWEKGKYNYLRKYRSKKAKEIWDKTPYKDRLKRTFNGRAIITKMTNTNALTSEERKLKW